MLFNLNLLKVLCCIHQSPYRFESFWSWIVETKAQHGYQKYPFLSLYFYLLAIVSFHLSMFGNLSVPMQPSHDFSLQVSVWTLMLYFYFSTRFFFEITSLFDCCLDCAKNTCVYNNNFINLLFVFYYFISFLNIVTPVNLDMLRIS